MTVTREFGAVWPLTVIMQDKFWSSSEEKKKDALQGEAYKTDKAKLTDKVFYAQPKRAKYKQTNKETC